MAPTASKAAGRNLLYQNVVIKLALADGEDKNLYRRIRLGRTPDPYAELKRRAILFSLDEEEEKFAGTDAYKVVIIYLDVDGDRVLICSNEELRDALNQYESAGSVKVTAVVKPKPGAKAPSSDSSRASVESSTQTQKTPTTEASTSTVAEKQKQTNEAVPRRSAPIKINDVVKGVVGVLAGAVVALESHLDAPAQLPAAPSAPTATEDAGSEASKGTEKVEPSESGARGVILTVPSGNKGMPPPKTNKVVRNTPEPVKVVPQKDEPVKVVPQKAEPVKVETKKVEPEPKKAEPVKVEPKKPEPVQVEPKKPEPVQVESKHLYSGYVAPGATVIFGESVKVKPEPVNVEPKKPEPEPQKPEPVEVEPKEPEAKDEPAKAAVSTEEEPKKPAEVKETVSEPAHPFIHGRHTCDSCLRTPIIGKRFHAVNLPDYDLCQNCYENNKSEEIKFEPAELDRDRPFQERWRARRAKWAGRGHRPGPHGPRRRGWGPPHRFGPPPYAPHHGHPPHPHGPPPHPHGPPPHPHGPPPHPHGPPPHPHGPPPPPHYPGPEQIDLVLKEAVRQSLEAARATHEKEVDSAVRQSLEGDRAAHEQDPDSKASKPEPAKAKAEQEEVVVEVKDTPETKEEPAVAHQPTEGKKDEPIKSADPDFDDLALQEAVRRSLAEPSAEVSSVPAESEPVKVQGAAETVKEVDDVADSAKEVEAVEDVPQTEKEVEENVSQPEKEVEDASKPEEDAETAVVGEVEQTNEAEDDTVVVQEKPEQNESIYADGNEPSGTVAAAFEDTLGKIGTEIESLQSELERKPCAEQTEQGAMIVDGVADSDPDEVATQSSWHVVDEDEKMASDEMLARAAQVIGSALFNSDMGRSAENVSQLTQSAESPAVESVASSDDASTITSVPTTVRSITEETQAPSQQHGRWALQLQQLHELGFHNEAVCCDILDRLYAANVGVDSNEEITVTQVVNELMREW